MRDDLQGKAEPSSARVYDYLIGGTENFPADRQAADAILTDWPELRPAARANRAFLSRVVADLTRRGFRQFLDLGSGLPTQENVHEVAQRIAPETRVVYVDKDPTAIAHGRALLRGSPRSRYLAADIRDVPDVLRAASATGLINYDEPLVLLMVAVLPFIQESDDAHGLILKYTTALAPGSRLVCSGMVSDTASPEALARIHGQFDNAPSPAFIRTRAQVDAVLKDLRPEPPGLANVRTWPAPGPEDEFPLNYGGVLIV
ncbi:SAM-dependent methyltransferase [Actinomadura rayongensis]|uniref:SAM-dependent methyltransferase n=1 Tax=Actinomadura rayongensis TaxID=1429076 RepID=A0A6I4W688_9ACTN|nr:SAM-dependent methyltransferase [Actinomadura rayongensis]MXQ65001.1 SAM-dependent methyltransferase [Actinomadura rayongensis]